MSIVVIGTIYIDIKGYPSSRFDPAGRNAGAVSQFHGGVGRNIAEDIAHAGLKPLFVSLAAADSMGSDVIKRLEDGGVDTTFIRRSDNGMGLWLAIFDNNGDVYANISQRADLSPVLDILKENCEEIFADSDGILLEIDMGREITEYVFEQAARYNKPVYGVISNINIALEMRDKILLTDCFICNQQEAGIFFSKDLEDLSAEEMLKVLPPLVKNAGLKQMIVTMGSKGAVYAGTGGKCGITPPHKVNVVDTTGAGDAFFAGAATGLIYGKTLAEASEIGTTLAAAVISSTENVCPRLNSADLGF